MIAIRIPEGNAFSLKIPAILQTETGKVNINTAACTDVVVTFGQNSRLTTYAHTTQDQYFLVNFPATLEKGDYDLHVNGKYGGVKFALHYIKGVAILPGYDSANAHDLVAGQPVVMPEQILVGSIMTDAQLNTLKATYQAKIQELAAAIAEYEAKVAEIEGVAKETNATSNKNAILQAISDKVVPTDYAKASDLLPLATEANATSNKNTITQAIAAALAVFTQWVAGAWTTFTAAAARKTDIPSDYAKAGAVAKDLDDIQVDLSTVAKQGTDPNVTLTSVDAKVTAATGNIVMMTAAEKAPAIADLKLRIV